MRLYCEIDLVGEAGLMAVERRWCSKSYMTRAGKLSNGDEYEGGFTKSVKLTEYLRVCIQYLSPLVTVPKV